VQQGFPKTNTISNKQGVAGIKISPFQSDSFAVLFRCYHHFLQKAIPNNLLRLNYKFNRNLWAGSGRHAVLRDVAFCGKHSSKLLTKD
jgi:hypothetical protein